MSHLHCLGIAGSFMVGIARLAIELGHTVSGSDIAYYPPMGDEAKRLNVDLLTGYDSDCTQCPADLYIIGNALSRGSPLVESILKQKRPYQSAPQWLYENVLRNRRVLAISGTHGKTTTSTLLAHLLEKRGYNPGFLIGGSVPNFGVSARLSPHSPFFVIEADEYDSAFFDKRPKFLHYHPEVLVINNIEFDHADIYTHLEMIIQQFHYLLRTVPNDGKIIAATDDSSIKQAIEMGVWTPIEYFGEQGDWHWKQKQDTLQIYHHNTLIEQTIPPLLGKINRNNLTAAIAAAAAVEIDLGGNNWQDFIPPLRRLQQVYDYNDIRLLDDFAHHPTAMRETIASLKENNQNRRIIAIISLQSNSMKMGVHQESLGAALSNADIIIALGEQPWLEKALIKSKTCFYIENNVKQIPNRLKQILTIGDDILLMSNGDWGKLIEDIKETIFHL